MHTRTLTFYTKYRGFLLHSFLLTKREVSDSNQKWIAGRCSCCTHFQCLGILILFSCLFRSSMSFSVKLMPAIPAMPLIRTMVKEPII